MGILKSESGQLHCYVVRSEEPKSTSVPQGYDGTEPIPKTRGVPSIKKGLVRCSFTGLNRTKCVDKCYENSRVVGMRLARSEGSFGELTDFMTYKDLVLKSLWSFQRSPGTFIVINHSF
jgi:hypothetical protein